jgi:hypothetical protein
LSQGTSLSQLNNRAAERRSAEVQTEREEHTYIHAELKPEDQYVNFEIFAVVTMNNLVFWNLTLCSCKNRRFGGTHRLHHQGDKIRLPVTVTVPSSPILVTLIMEAICSSETSVLTRTTRCNIQANVILQKTNSF